MEFWGFCTEIDRERRPFPPCALRGFEFTPISYGLWFVFGWIRFSIVNSWARDERLVLDDFVTLWSSSNSSSLEPNPPKPRVSTNQSSCILEKIPILLGISLIPSKPWSNSSIPSVDVFTSPLWPCLQILVRFGLDLVTRSSSFRKNAGWKAFLDSVFPSTGWTDALKLYASDQPVSRFLLN